MEFCPKTINIRRTKIKGSEKLDLQENHDTASLQKILVYIDETVVVRLLGFHVQNKKYCLKLKNENADKKFCNDIKSKYVHFQIINEGQPLEKSTFLLAFLPRDKVEKELYHVVRELCDIIEWLDIRQQTNFIIFRFGPPRHQMENIIYWQRCLEKVISEIRKEYAIRQLLGRIKNVREDNDKCLIITYASQFESINVS